jgi:hypothetical protein
VCGDYLRSFLGIIVVEMFGKEVLRVWEGRKGDTVEPRLFQLSNISTPKSVLFF